jgi:hypothetical protein
VRPDMCWSSSGLHREGMRIIEEQFPPPKRRKKSRTSRARRPHK